MVRGEGVLDRAAIATLCLSPAQEPTVRHDEFRLDDLLLELASHEYEGAGHPPLKVRGARGPSGVANGRILQRSVGGSDFAEKSGSGAG
jgi:hypothetical protein